MFTENSQWNYYPTAFISYCLLLFNSRKLYLLEINYIIFSINRNVGENVSFSTSENWTLSSSGIGCRIARIWGVWILISMMEKLLSNLVHMWWFYMCHWHYVPCKRFTLKYNRTQFELRNSAASWYSNPNPYLESSAGSRLEEVGFLM